MNGDLMDRFVADLKLKGYQKRGVQSYRGLCSVTGKTVLRLFFQSVLVQRKMKEMGCGCYASVGNGKTDPRR